MKAGRFSNGWILAALLLVIVIIAGGVFIWLNNSHSNAIEINLAPETETLGNIYISGEVNNPGWYPVFAGDTVGDLIRAAGGLKDGVDVSQATLTMGGVDEGNIPQKIDINRADTWLLEALPGVGEAKAKAIIDYRETNGPFRDINELEKVPGFGEGILDNIKDLITVND